MRGSPCPAWVHDQGVLFSASAWDARKHEASMSRPPRTSWWARADAPTPREAQLYLRIPVFLGFPYLVTKLGSVPFRHISLLPVDRRRDDLRDLARRQCLANQLETFLHLGVDESRHFEPSGRESDLDGELPMGPPIWGSLRPPEAFSNSREQARRQERLERYVAEYPSPPSIRMAEPAAAGRLATAEEIERLGRRLPDGSRSAVRRCQTCQCVRGEWLAADGEGNGDPRPRVVFVHCRCDNDNRCARCGQPLGEGRLGSFKYDDTKLGGGVRFLHPFFGISHRCPG